MQTPLPLPKPLFEQILQYSNTLDNYRFMLVSREAQAQVTEAMTKHKHQIYLIHQELNDLTENGSNMLPRQILISLSSATLTTILKLLHITNYPQGKVKFTPCILNGIKELSTLNFSNKMTIQALSNFIAMIKIKLFANPLFDFYTVDTYLSEGLLLAQQWCAATNSADSFFVLSAYYRLNHKQQGMESCYEKEDDIPSIDADISLDEFNLCIHKALQIIDGGLYLYVKDNINLLHAFANVHACRIIKALKEQHIFYQHFITLGTEKIAHMCMAGKADMLNNNHLYSITNTRDF